MDHEVFISYSSKNSAVAELILNALEAASVKCWMAPQALEGGDEYEEVIEEAIRTCRIFVLVFSEPAVNSRWVNSELSIAFMEYKHIIPFKIDQTVLSGKMRVKLIQSHWINAYPEVAERIGELVRSVKATLEGIEAGKAEIVIDESAKVLNFVQRFEYEDAQNCFQEKKYAEAIDMLLPMALKGNRESQELLCRIYYAISVSSMDYSIIRRISPAIKDSIDAVAASGADWANFVCHCYAYSQNDNKQSLDFLKKAISGDSIGLAFLRLGIVYKWGLGVDVSSGHAVRCYERAIELGSVEAYSYMAQAYNWGFEGQLPDQDRAIEYYQKGIDGRDWRAIKGLFDLLAFSDTTGSRLDEAFSYLEKLSDEDVEGIELLYGEYYYSKFFFQGNYEKDWQQAVYFYEIALNNGYYGACGDLSHLYMSDSMEKAKEYAEMGYLHGDTDSYLALIMLEKMEQNYARAWEIAEERYERFATSSGDLGELFIENGYLPSEDYLPTLIKILQTSAAVGHQDACKCLITLYSDEKFGMVDSDMEEKYRHMSAMIGETSDEPGGVDAVVDYAKYHLEANTAHYNPRIAVKYLKKAIDRDPQRRDAPELLLQQYRGKDSSYYQKRYDKARFFILKREAYDAEKMFDDFIGMPLSEESAPLIEEFLLKAIEITDDGFAKKRIRVTGDGFAKKRIRVTGDGFAKKRIRVTDDGFAKKRIRAAIELLKGNFEKHWNLSKEEFDSAREQLKTGVEEFPYIIGNFCKEYVKQLFPEYDDEVGKGDFLKGTNTDAAQLFYAMNHSLLCECSVVEQDRYLARLLTPVCEDACYEEIIARQDGHLVDEEELWSSPLEHFDNYYRRVCHHYGVFPLESFARCPFEEIVPFFPREKALDYYKNALRALYHFSEHTEFKRISELLNQDEEMLNYAEKELEHDQDLQLLLILFVEIRLDVENLLIDGNNVLDAVYSKDDDVLIKYVQDFVDRLDKAGVQHNLKVPDHQQLTELLHPSENCPEGSPF